VSVEAPRTSDLVADDVEKATPDRAPSPGGRPDDDDEPIDDVLPRTTATPHEPLPNDYEDPTIGLDAEQQNISEPEQQPEDQGPTTEPYDEQETADEHHQLPEATVEPDIPSDTASEPAAPTEQEQPSTRTGQSRAHLKRNCGPPKRLGLDEVLALIHRIPWLGRPGGRSGVTVAS
jgi:hypothetical protein